MHAHVVLITVLLGLTACSGPSSGAAPPARPPRPAPAASTAVNAWFPRAPVLIAHRGGAAEAPEGTLLAYRRALAAGADVLELDVQASRDGALVVVHDREVDRTTDGTGRVEELTLAQLQALDAAYSFVPGEGAVPGRAVDSYPLRGVATGESPPPAGIEPVDLRIRTVAEVLTALPGAALAIEVKPSGAPGEAVARELAALLRGDAAGTPREVYVAAEDEDVLAAFRAAAPGSATSASRGELTRDYLAVLRGEALPTPPSQVLAVPRPEQDPVPGELVTARFVQAAHDAGLAVHVFTVDSCEQAAEMRDRGVDGLYTDRPAALRTCWP